MVDDEMSGRGSDDYDEALAQWFAALESAPAPDVWERIVAGRDEPALGPLGRGRSRRVLATLAAAGVLVAGVFGVARLQSGDSESMSLTADGAPSGTSNDDGGPSVPCDAVAVADRLQVGVATMDFEPSVSPSALADATVVLWGQLVYVDRSPDGSGSVVQVKVADVVGADPTDFARGAQLLIVGSGPGEAAGMLSGNFLAFVVPGSGGEAPWEVVAEGLWVGCSNEDAAVPVLVRPEAAGWGPVLDRGVTLAALWDAAVFGDEGRGSPLPAPLVAGDGTAVFDLVLVGGDRFRVSVPEELADGFARVVEPAGGGPIELIGPEASLSIALEFCADQDGMVENRLGSAVRVEGSIVRFCRADELVSATLETDAELDGAAEHVDVRPIAMGSRYGPVLAGAWPSLAECGNCAPWGPMVYPDAGVVVNRTGDTRLTAVSLDDLSEMWTTDTGGGAAYLHGGPGGVFVEITGGDFQRLDPATGEVEWRIVRNEAERDAALTGFGDGTWLLRSSFAVEGDDRAPLLRSIDPETGAVLWIAEGRPGTEWQRSDATAIDGLVIIMDVTSNPLVDTEPTGGSLRAYELSTGRLAWTADLVSPTEAFSDGLIHVLEVDSGPILLARTVDGDLVRVDPVTGAIRWRATIGRAVIDGTVFAADGRLAISLSGGAIPALDPETGSAAPIG